MVNHHWTKDLPLFARAMVLAGGTLFIAGPADMIDEDQVFKQIDDPKVGSSLADQATALEGKKGALLWAVSVTNGEKLSEHQLDDSPVFDGMAAANGRLYVAATGGSVLCFSGEK